MSDRELRWQSGIGPATLPSSELHVWKISLEQTPQRVRAFRALLCSEELQRCERLHFPRDRDGFCVCRGYLRVLLGRYGGAAPDRIRLTRGIHGKLALDRRVHETDIEFNVSHSGCLALIALARGRRVGVDIERAGPAGRIELISSRFFSAEEDESIRALPEESRDRAFYACWTRKEAAIKALGGSIAMLARVIVSTDPEGPARILQMPSAAPAGGGNERWHLHDLPADEGYAAALCYGGPDAALRLWQPDR
jgi:4'-phosphopantetheinyl transferase